MTLSAPQKKMIRDYTLIVVGSLIVASGYVFFITPYRIIPGGVYGVSIILHYLVKDWMDIALPIGMTALFFNIPLAYAAYRLLGAGAIFKTVVTFVSTSLFVDLLSIFQGNHQLVEGDSLLASIYGGVLIGIGVATIFRAKATSAGTDVLSKIMAKYFHVPVGYSIILVDSFIVLMGLIAFGEWSVPLYSWITIFVYGKVVDILQQGLSTDRAVFIISKNNDEISQMILHKLKRGGTFFHGKGMFRGEDREIVYTVVNGRQIPQLREYINDIDPQAFITVLPAHEILGQGFKSLDESVKDK